MTSSSSKPSFDDLLAHADWLRRLSRQLAGVSADADDLAQDTWVAALGRGGPDPGRSPRPWFVRVMHNFRRMRARGEVRRRAREEAAAPELAAAGAFPDTGALVERVELQRRVARLVLDLDEPYRTTVLLSFYDGRSSPEVGRAMGIPEGTVRWRLKEAIGRLRRELDEGQGPGVRNWRAILVPAGPAALSPETLGKGGLLMAAKSKLGAAGALVSFLALLAGGGWWWRTHGPGAPSPDGPAIANLPEIDRGRLRVFGAAAATDRPAVIGEVRGPDGTAIDGAFLTAIRQRQDPRPGETNDPRPRAAARSANGGQFRLELPGPGQYRVTASAPGLLPATADAALASPGATTRVDLRLARGGVSVTGRVQDSGGGPIVHAEVRADGPDVGLVMTATAADGSYRINLPPGRYNLTADADGYAPERKGVEAQADVEQSFRLHPASRVSGRVIEKSTGAPVAGALVRAGDDGRGTGRETTSTENGSFTFADLDPGRYLLSAAKGKLVGFAPAPAAVALAGHVDGLEIALESAFTISGQVRDRAGRGVPSAHVKMEEDRGASFGIIRGNVIALADADGRYRIDGVLPGRFRLGGEAPAHAPAAPREVQVIARDVVAVDLTVEPGGELHGQVTTHDGNPAGDTDVLAEVRAGDRGDAPSRSWSRGRTGRGGRFVITGLGAGRLTVTAQHPRLGTQVVGPITVAAGERKEVSIRLQKPAFISGQVKYEDGAPAARVRVRWDGHGNAARDRLSAMTDGDGRFRVGPAVAGKGFLKAEPMSANRGSFGPREGANEKALTLAEGDDVTGVELILPRYDKSIAGVVLDPDGQPFEGATVGVEPEREGRSRRPVWMLGHQDSKHVSDADGRFTIPELKAGGYTVWALHPRFPVVELAHVAAGAAGVRLRLRPGATLSGVVVDAAGAPVRRCDVQVIPAEGPNLPEDRSVGGMEEGTRRPVNNPGGTFEVGGLKAGRYDVLATSVDGAAGRLAGVPLREGEARSGLRVVLARALRLRGRVVDGENGQGIAGLGIGMTRTREHLHTRSDSSGGFVIDRLVPGRTIVINVRGDRSYIGETREVTLPEGKTEVEIPAFRLLPVRPSDAGIDEARGTLGLQLSARDLPPKVLAVVPDSPAARAGIPAGATLHAVDGQDLAGYGRSAAYRLLGGPPGSQATLTIAPPRGERRTVTLVRAALDPR